MALFTDNEIRYMTEQRLGRLATVTKSGDPHVIPVNFMFNPQTQTIDIVGREMSKSLKYRNIVGFGRASFVIDDVVSVMPYRTRLLHIRGAAEIVCRKPGDPVPMAPSAPKMTAEMIAVRSRGVSAEMIRIRPEKIVAAGLEGDPAEMTSRRIAPDGTVLSTRRYIQPYGGGEKRADQQV